MENDSSVLFNTEALSFDSTLDSLLDVEYIVDNKTIPFNPPFNTPSDIHISSQKSFEADTAYVDSDRTDCKEPGSTTDMMDMEIQENVNDVGEDVNVVIETLHSPHDENQKGNVNESDYLEKKQKHGKNKLLDNRSPGKRNGKNKQLEIDNGIKESGLNNLRESSPNFDQIKVKRERNLAKRKSTNSSASKAGKSVSTCPVNSMSVAAEKPNTAYSKSDILENGDHTNEPPTKRLKTIPKKHNRKCLSAAVEVVPSDLITKARTGATVEVCPLLVTSTSIGIRNQISKSEPISIENCMLSKSEETVKMVVNPETEKNDHFEKGNCLPDETVENFDLKDTVQDDELREQQTKVIVHDEEMNEQSNAELNELNMQHLELKTIVMSKDAHNNEDKVGHGIIEPETTADQRVVIDMDDVTCGVDSDTGNGEEEGMEEQVDDVVDDDEEEEDDDDDDVDDDEIHNWLEEGLTKEEIREKKKEELKEGEFISTEKSILIEKGTNPFETLPVGWVQIYHKCGMPVYLHKESRVCTFAQPYFIGSGSSRNHNIPMSSIPCLQYLRAVEKEHAEQSETTEKQTLESGVDGATDVDASGIDYLPRPVVQHAEETLKTIQLEPADMTIYCKRLFNFKQVTVKRFKTWREKRAHLTKERKRKDTTVPQMAADTKLITCAIPAEYTNKKFKKKEFVLNPDGKTAVSILHEYTQNILRVQPTYEFKEIVNAELPFQATVMINGLQYGRGIASGKRQAKNEGAKATLEIFIPELAEIWASDKSAAKQKAESVHDLKFFEEVAIQDPRVPELCVKSSLPQPYQVLGTCLQRNYGLGDTTFKVDKKMISNQKTEFTLTVGKRACTVVCKNKREAKQRAAQAMLQQLHPLLKNWAAILRLYSKNSEVGFNERKDEFSVQDLQQEKKKNFEILAKLKEAMLSVREHRKQLVGKSTSTIIETATLNL